MALSLVHNTEQYGQDHGGCLRGLDDNIFGRTNLYLSLNLFVPRTMLAADAVQSSNVPIRNSPKYIDGDVST